MSVRGSIVFAVLLALGTAVLVLWPGSEALLGRKVVRFTVWGMPFEDRLFVDRYAERWEELNPGIDVDYGRYADAKMKYNAWHARGHGAEVMRMEITWYPDFVRRGMLEPLTEYIRDPAAGLSQEQMAKFPSHLMEELWIGGGLYALPQDNAQYGLFYNKAIFDRHNEEHPEDPVPYPSAEWTWADLRAAAKKLTRHDEQGRIVQRGFDVAIWAWPFMTLHAQAGGEVWSKDGLTCLIDSAAGVEALEFLRAMQREDRSFAPTLGHYTAGVGADTLFASGGTAMLMDGSWRVPNFDLTAPGLDFAVAPLPRGKVPAVITGSVLWAISADAANKAEAWAFLRWLVADEQAAAYWETLRVAPPANLAVVGSPAFRSTRGVPRDPEDLGKGYEVPPMPESAYPEKAAWLLWANRPHPETGEPPGFVPVHPFQADLQDEITRMLTAYLRPGSTLGARDALDAAVRHVHALIDRDRAARGLPAADRETGVATDGHR